MALKPARLQWSEDGSPLSADYGDVYFQKGRGPDESRYVFLRCNRLEERFSSADVFRVGELGFGTGLNFLMTAELWRKTAPKRARLVYAAVEKHPVSIADLARLFAGWPELEEFTQPLLAQYPPMVEGFHHIHLPGIRLMLLFGDVDDVLPQLDGKFDAWYLDGFAPAKNPEMWGDALFPLIAARTAPGGTLSTFTVAGAVRRGLAAAGFEVEKVKGFGAKWSMTAARMAGESAPIAKKPVTVLGAGMAGCSAARALAEKGFSVRVVDRRESFAREASGNPAGVLYPKLTVDRSPMGEYHLHGFCYTRGLLERLKLPSWTPCGVVRLDLDDDEARRTQALVEKNDWPPELARRLGDAGEVEPLAAGRSALYHESAGYLSPPEFCAALLDHPLIEKVFEENVTALPEGTVVIALANGANGFEETAWLPLHPLRGQISLLAATEESRKLKHVVCHEGFVIPVVEGAHVAGATFQKEAVGAATLREEDHAENTEKLARYLPALHAGEVTGGRAGWRCTTPDKLPLVGGVPDRAAFLAKEARHVPDVYLCVGFGAHGLSGAPLAGEIVACLIAGDPLPVPASLLPSLAPERFILRAMKRQARPMREE